MIVHDSGYWMRLVQATAALGLACLLSSSHAAAGPDRERALELFKESKSLYRDGRFREAIDRLQRAHALEPEPVLLYNLGRAYEGIGELERAIDAYERYLKDDPDAPDRGAIEARVATLRQQLAERADMAKQRDAAERKAPPPAASSPRSSPPSSGSEPSSGAGVWPWLVAGTGAVVLGAGAFFAVRAEQRHDQADDEVTALGARDRQDEAERLASTANVAFIAGGILAAGGLTWALVDGASREPSRARLSLRVAPAEIGLGGRF